MSKIFVKKLSRKSWRVMFKVGPQSFTIGAWDWSSRSEARWYAAQFRKAINVIKGTGVRFYAYQFQSVRGLGPKVKVKRR